MRGPALFAALVIGALQQLPNQRFEVIPQAAHATVGDTVTLLFRVRLDPQDLLYDTVPAPVGALPEGVHVLAVEKLQRDQMRDYVGRARIVFFRPGPQAVPMFGLPFMRGVKGMTRALLVSDSALVDITPVAPPGNPSLKDIREIQAPGHPIGWLLVGLLGPLGLVWLLIRTGTRRPEPAAPVAPAAIQEASPTAYDQAIAMLAAIEGAQWPSRGEVDRHFAAVTDTLRCYLKRAHGVQAPTLTTRELAEVLPTVVAGDGRGRRFLELLGQGDLVKFARVMPSADAAERYLREARVLLDQWHLLAAGEPQR